MKSSLLVTAGLTALATFVALAPGCSSDEGSPSPEFTGGTAGTGGTGGSPATGATGGETAAGGTGGEGVGGLAGASAGGSSTGGGPSGPPTTLSETGLYESDMETLAPGVRPFEPAFGLWTDGAAKRRWIKLPDDSQIDTSEMDYWEFPAGTKLWKEFSRDDVRVETRLLERRPDGSWWMMAYQWREDLSDADAVPDGLENASTTDHDIPSSFDCTQCHSKMPGRVLGFSAIQLSHEPTLGGEVVGELTLDALVSEGLLTDVPGDLTLPGTATDQAALGYLHANCGHCHNPQSSVQGRVDMVLWLAADSLSTVEETPTYQTTVGATQTAENSPPDSTHRIVAKNPEASGVYLRMGARGEEYDMPPLGTEDVDPAGTSAIEAWIDSLPLAP